MVKLDPIYGNTTYENTSECLVRADSEQETRMLVFCPPPTQIQAGIIIGTCVAAHLLRRRWGPGRGPIRGASGSLENARRRSRRTPSGLLSDGHWHRSPSVEANPPTRGQNDAQTSLVLVTTNREGAPAVSGAPRRGLPGNAGFDSITRRRSP